MVEFCHLSGWSKNCGGFLFLFYSRKKSLLLWNKIKIDLYKRRDRYGIISIRSNIGFKTWYGSSRFRRRKTLRLTSFFFLFYILLHQINRRVLEKMNNLSVRSRLFIKKNASTILTTIGSVGVVATAVLAVKATPKAMILLEEAKQEKGEDLTTLETLKVTGKVYIPTVLTGVSTIACIVGANVLNHRQQAALMSAYALLDNSFKEYKKKLIELHGQETHEEVMNAIAIEKAETMYVRGSYFGSSCDLTSDESCSEPVLFYEEYSNRYFESTIEQVINAAYHLNRNYILRGYSYLNELYEFLGLEETDYGSVLGWTPTDEGEYWIEFNYRKVTLNNGRDCYILELPFEPTYDFLECSYY